MSLLFVMSTVFLPLIGYIVDKVGLRVILLQFSAILMVVAFSLMLFKFLLVPLVMIGFSYALFGAVVWPVVAYLVPRNQLGTGMGILTSLQNFGLGIAPLMVTYVKSQYGTNHSIIIFFLIVSLFSVLFSSYVHYLDTKREVSLNDSSQEKIIECLEKQCRLMKTPIQSASHSFNDIEKN